MSKKFFGTDGIRGKVGNYPITADFILKLGWAVGRVMSAQGKDLVMIGKDTRISGYMFESALEAGLTTAGVNTRLLGPMPTPAIAYLTRTFRACAGIVISASHNPYYDNGIKFFSSTGHKLDDEIELAIEAELEKEMTTVDSAKLGRVQRLQDAGGRYIEFCKHSIGAGLSLKGMRIVLDCANGATYQVAPAVFEELGAFVHKLGVSPNGLNINLDAGSTKPEELQKKVLEVGADIGIAFDGDGDRVIMVDENGNIVDGDELLYVMAQGRIEEGVDIGPVVGTLMTNLGLEHAIKRLDVPFIRANVGDRYVLEQLIKHNGILGGESSGHLICLDKQTTGDGIVSALQVLAALLRKNMSLGEICKPVEKYPQHMINVKVVDKEKVKQSEEVKAAVASAEEALGDRGRVLIRPSGTEPVVRVMVEGVDLSEVNMHTAELADVVKSVK